MGASKQAGLVLTGAVAKGAFHAGALSVLAARGVPITSIVGASAGALNALVFGAGIATGRVCLAARLAEDAWIDHACWSHVMSFSLRAIAHARGISGTSEVHAMVGELVRRVLTASEPPDRAPNRELALRLIASDLTGHKKSDEAPFEPVQTTYEQSFEFAGVDFFQPRALDRMLECAAASAAFPGLFAPMVINGRSYMDGGAVNNHPISHALESTVTDRALVVSPLPAVIPPPGSLDGIALAEHFVDVLFSERLFRDLRAASRVNEKLARLERTFDQMALPEHWRSAIRNDLGWRPLEVVEIRPDEILSGGAFAGFSHKHLRLEYVDAGRACASRVLDHLDRLDEHGAAHG